MLLESVIGKNITSENFSTLLIFYFDRNLELRNTYLIILSYQWQSEPLSITLEELSCDIVN